MEDRTKANGRMANSMAKEHLSLQQELRDKEPGKMERGSDGTTKTQINNKTMSNDIWNINQKLFNMNKN